MFAISYHTVNVLLMVWDDLSTSESCDCRDAARARARSIAIAIAIAMESIVEGSKIMLACTLL